MSEKPGYIPPEAEQENKSKEENKFKKKLKNAFGRKNTVKEDDVPEYLFLGSRRPENPIIYRPNPAHKNYEENLRKAKDRDEPLVAPLEEKGDTSLEDE